MDFLEDIKPQDGKIKGKVALYMKQGAGYSTAKGIHFTSEQPYQLVDIEEVSELLLTDRFEIADPNDIRTYFGLQQ